MNISVREFRESDRELLRDLFVAARTEAFSWASPNEHLLEDFDIVTEGEKILVAVHANNPIGFASICEANSFLHNLFIHPEFQGLGAGKILLAGCEKYFSAVPTLKCVKANTRAARFYESQGWKVRCEAEGPDGPYFLMERVRRDKSIDNRLESYRRPSAVNENAPGVKGSCRCGRIQFEVSTKPLITMACHCTGCQKMTSSAFSLSSLFPSSVFSLTSGEPVIGGLHGSARHYFCEYCMSWLFTRPEGMDDFVNVRSTMLEDSQHYKPFIETWLDEKLEWATTGAKHSFNKFPPQERFPELLQEYADGKD